MNSVLVMVTAPKVHAELIAPAAVALPLVKRSRPPRISANFSSFTNVSMAAVMSIPRRIGHSAL